MAFFEKVAAGAHPDDRPVKIYKGNMRMEVNMDFSFND